MKKLSSKKIELIQKQRRMKMQAYFKSLGNSTNKQNVTIATMFNLLISSLVIFFK